MIWVRAGVLFWAINQAVDGVHCLLVFSWQGKRAMWLSVLAGELTIGEGSKAYQNHRARAAIRKDLRNFKGVMFARGSQVSDIKLLSAAVGRFLCFFRLVAPCLSLFFYLSFCLSLSRSLGCVT